MTPPVPEHSEPEGVSGNLISQLIASISGLFVGLLYRGDFTTAAFVFTASFVFAFAGWWARGLRQ